MIHDLPIDINQVLPDVKDRRTALGGLQSMVFEGKLPESAAQFIWSTYLAPLYDARTAAQGWRHGKCIRCGAVHPGSPLAKKRNVRFSHHMWCPAYVGPLSHAISRVETNFMGDRAQCLCGRYYQLWADEMGTKKSACPDILFIWRGPKEVIDMGGKEHPILEPRPEPDPEPENV